MQDREQATGKRRAIGSAWLHRLALLTAGTTLLLLFIGGLVTGTGSGLAVPDWPTSFGHNMFLYPWSKMIGGIFYEHSHRLIGSVVGFLTLVLAVMLWMVESRRWLRWLGVIALGAVMVQGVLGGLRVLLLQQTIAIIHAALAQAFFALTVSVALFTSPEWREPPQRIPAADAASLRRLCVAVTGTIYLQLLFGAVLRYTGERLDAHLLFAALVSAGVLWLVRRVLDRFAGRVGLVRPVIVLCGLLVLQLILGLGSYLGKFTLFAEALSPFAWVMLTTAHLVVGALMLVTCLVLTLRAYHLLVLPRPVVGPAFVSEQVSM